MPFQAEGVDDLRRHLRRVKDRELDDELKAIHKALAEEILKLAEPKVRVKTGRLLRSLRAAGTKADAIGRIGSASVPYAAKVHWKYGPPFLTDAAAAIERDVVDRVYDAQIADMLDRTIGR